ncbi:hypothetical protein PVW46_15415 [Mameliella sp. AT18]|uniref:hypothetical protein n=1 Tax=Mameliella sp. AT18 TaxID=3028385 RepID=UPI00237AC256|nr:hypothetical protein [Mameliella sp. AT18]MDD9731297.1 hypothetical protein [Mameliella sp. AT18]
MSPADRSQRRLLIGAESFADARAALEIADHLAGSLATKLTGFLAENPFALDLVRREGQRLVTESGQIRDAPSLERMQTMFESEQKAFGRSLARISERHKLTWSMERQSGELVPALCHAALGADLLVLGQRYRPAQRDPVVLVLSPTASASEATQIGEELARHFRTGLTDTGADEEDLPGQISRARARAVIVDLAEGPVQTMDGLREVVIAARCPVLVLGAAAGRD